MHKYSNQCEHVAAITTMTGLLGMMPCEGSERLPEGKSPFTISSHTLLLSGIFLGGSRCAVRIRMAYPGSAVAMEFSVRSDKNEVSQLLIESIG